MRARRAARKGNGRCAVTFVERAQETALAWGARRFGLVSIPSPSGIPRHLSARFGPPDGDEHLERSRTSVVPWLDRVRRLDGARILEVGAGAGPGAGASTVALAEQGARVLAVDVDERHLEASAQRCATAGLGDVRFRAASAAELDRVAARGDHDVVVIRGMLEHLSFSERMAALAGAWSLLEPGGHLVVVETPNRLWHLDEPTTREPFFRGLADDAAIRRATGASGPLFDTELAEHLAPAAFARWGRGVSFHDFVLALGMTAERLPVVSSLEEFLRRCLRRSPGRDGRYLRTVHSLAPGIPKGFFFASLDLALEKQI